MFQLINQIPITAALDKLSIQYRNLGSGTYGIIQDGKLTDGYRINTKRNYVSDFSKCSRPQGPPFSFVKRFLNLTNHETFKRFETNFNIRSEIKRPKNKGSPKEKKNMNASSYSRRWLRS